MNDENKKLLKFLVTQPAKFLRYHDATLWYGIAYAKRSETGDKVMDYYFPDHLTFEFPVPISDIGTATFNAEEKGLLMMRYIRRHLELKEQASGHPGDPQ